MQKTLYAYVVEAVAVNAKTELKLESLKDDLINVIALICKLDKNRRKQDLVVDKKVVYLDSYEYDKDNEIINLKFVSAKYDARRNVIDTETLRSRGILKTDKDGDEEKTHACFKFMDGIVCECLCESNYYGIGIGKILKYLEYYTKKYHKKKSDGIYYNLTYRNIVSEDFLKSLSKLSRIRAVTLTVDQEDLSVSDYKALAGRKDIRDEVDIVLKPAARGMSINRDTVKEFYKLYTAKDRAIKRVTVDGDAQDKEPLTFNTEQMKAKIVIEVQQTFTNEVDTRSIFDRMYTEILSLEEG